MLVMQGRGGQPVEQQPSDDTGFYYLHENGELIFKRDRPEVESGGFVRKVWPFRSEERESVWIIAIEGMALGARRGRVMELAAHWQLTDEDAQVFCERTKETKLFKDGDQWCAVFHDFINVQESQCGFGTTALEALAELAKSGLVQP